MPIACHTKGSRESMNGTLSNIGGYTPTPPIFSFFETRTSPSSSSSSSFSRRTNPNPNPKHFRIESVVVEPVLSKLSDVTRSESVSRRLILLRHANSSWANPSLRDHDRPLSKSGQADAVNVSDKLEKMDWVPQLILSSDAVRTRETLNIMQKQVKRFLKAEVYFISSFYSIAAMDGQTAEHLQQAICKFAKDEILTVMCMGHNRGWEEAASMFSGVSVELKTCNAALLEATGKSWEEAFSLAGLGGWKLQGIVSPITGL